VKRWVRLPIVLLLCAVLGAGAVLHVLTLQLLCPPRRALRDYHRERFETPEEFALTISPLAIQARDGVKLAALEVYSCPRPGLAERYRRMRQRLEDSQTYPLIAPGSPPRATLILLHGRKGRKEDALPIAERFVAAGFACVLLDGRAHGDSGGAYCTFGGLEAGDVSAVIDELTRRHGSRMGPVGLFGVSLGGAVALRTAAVDSRVRAVASVSTFADLGDLLHHRFGQGKWDWLLPLLRLDARLTSGADVLGPGPEACLARLNAPVLIVHGREDREIPFEHGERLYRAFPTGQARLLPIEGAGHNNVLATGGDDLYEAVIWFFWEHLAHEDVAALTGKVRA